jgi:RHS repeat-associated protein
MMLGSVVRRFSTTLSVALAIGSTAATPIRAQPFAVFVTPSSGAYHTTTIGSVPFPLFTIIWTDSISTSATVAVTCSGVVTSCSFQGSGGKTSINLPLIWPGGIAFETIVGTTTGGGQGIVKLKVTTTSPASVDSGYYTVTIPPVHTATVTVSPPSVVGTPGQNTVTTFTVTNTGNMTDTLHFFDECSGPVFSSCGSPSLSSAILTAGQNTPVTVQFMSGPAGASGSLRLSATENNGVAVSALQSVTTTATAGIDVADVNPGVSFSRGSCVTVAIAPHAASECGALRITHALPSVRTYNKVRTPTLIYNSGLAAPFMPLNALLTIPTVSGTTLSSVSGQLKVWQHATGTPTVVASGTWPGSDWGSLSSPTTRRLQLIWKYGQEAHDGLYDYTFTTTRTYANNSTAQDSATGQLILANRYTTPEFGSGWYLAGLERIHFSDSAIAWIGGDGSTQLYVPCGTNLYCPKTYVDGRDSITFDGTAYTRHAPHGGRVVFNSAGLDSAAFDREGHETQFRFDSYQRLDTIWVPSPSNDTAMYYAFAYNLPNATFYLQQVSAPGPNGTRRLVSLTNRMLVQTAAAGQTQITDPDGQSIQFSFNPEPGGDTIIQTWDLPLTLTSRTDKRGTQTLFTYAPDYGMLASATTHMQGTGTDITRTITTLGFGTAAADIPSPHAVVPDSAFITLHGPRSNAGDAGDTARFWFDRWWQPTTIWDAFGDITRVRRDNQTYPTRVTLVQDPLGRVQTAGYTARGYVAADSDLGVYLTKYPVTTYQYDDRWDVDTETTLPASETLHDGYDANGNHISHQLGTSTTFQTTFNYGGPCGGLVSSDVLPGTAKDSILYDTRLCNDSATRTPKGYWTLYNTDGVGRITQVTTPIDSLDKTVTIGSYARAQVSHALNVMDRDTLTQTMGPALNGAVQQTAFVQLTLDPNGNVLKVRRWSTPNDAALDTLFTATVYDRANRPTTDTAVNTGVTTRTFDTDGNLKTVLTPRGYTITSTFDALNRLSTKIVPSFVDSTWKTGIPTDPIDALYRTDTTVASGFGPWAVLPYGGQLVHGDTVTFTYDADSRITEADNANAHISRQYYYNGLLESETQRVRTVPFPGDFTTHAYTVGYHYDLEGRRDSLYFPWILGVADGMGSIGTTQSYSYNSTTGWLQSTTDPTGSVFHYGYVPRGDLDTLQLPSASGYRQVRTYDDDGNLASELVDKVTGSDTVLRNATFRYDARGKVLYGTSTAGLPNTMTSKYSGLGYLVSMQRTDSVPQNGTTATSGLTYHYDALGNKLVDTTSNGAFNPFGSSTVVSPVYWGYDAPTGFLNSSRGISGINGVIGNWVYDRSGNTEFYYTIITNASPVVMYDRASFYNAEERLVEADYREITDPLNSVPSGFMKRVDEVSEYDAFGRRVKVLANRFCAPVVNWGDAPHACNRTLARRTVWDGNQELAEFQVQDSTPVVELDGGIVKLGISPTFQDMQDNNPFFGQVMYVHGLATDQPLAVVRLNYADSSTFTGSALPYLLRAPIDVIPLWNSVGRMDIILGTNLCVTYQSTKRCPKMARQVGFGAFNNVVELGPVSWMGSLLEDKVEQSFTLFRRNRVYDPVTGRFTQPDPIGLAGGINDYGFGSGDPVNYSDPFGLCAGQDSTKAKSRVQVCTDIAHLPLNSIFHLHHMWLRTSTKEAGLGQAGGNVPGEGQYDLYNNLPFYTETEVVDHTGRGDQPGATCTDVANVNEYCVNDALDVGKKKGTFKPATGNDCQSFAKQVVNECTMRPIPPVQSDATGAGPRRSQQ